MTNIDFNVKRPETQGWKMYANEITNNNNKANLQLHDTNGITLSGDNGITLTSNNGITLSGNNTIIKLDDTSGISINGMGITLCGNNNNINLDSNGISISGNITTNGDIKLNDGSLNIMDGNFNLGDIDGSNTYKFVIDNSIQSFAIAISGTGVIDSQSHENQILIKNGNIRVKGTVFANSNELTSDDRLKFNETDISNALNVIRKLKPQDYDKSKHLNQEIDTKKESGFIAQDVVLIPELQHVVIQPLNSHDKFYLNYNQIFVYGIASLKELDTIVQNLQNEINKYNTIITNVAASINLVKSENTLLKAENTLIKSKLNIILSQMGQQTI